MTDQKLAPYQRLKTILNEGSETLTTKAEKNLDELLGIEKQETFWTKIHNFIIKIDQKIFKQKSKISTQYHRRKVR